jgi:predicted ATPase
LDVLRQALGQLVPGVRSVEIRHDEEVAEHRLSIITRDGTKLPARLASDGTLRMLALLAALFDAEGGTLCFEEPENGLHPGQLRALIELLVERTAADVQPPLEVISTSHSPVVLAALIEAQRAAPEQVGIYFMDTARHIPEGATDPSQISTVSRVRRVVSDGESGRDVVTRGEVERYLHTADVEG